jgi:hypothetical protein
MAKVKLKAVLTATIIYEVEEDYDGCSSVADLCRHEQEAIRADPTEFCDAAGVKFMAKVSRVKAAEK